MNTKLEFIFVIMFLLVSNAFAVGTVGCLNGVYTDASGVDYVLMDTNLWVDENGEIYTGPSLSEANLIPKDHDNYKDIMDDSKYPELALTLSEQLKDDKNTQLASNADANDAVKPTVTDSYTVKNKDNEPDHIKKYMTENGEDVVERVGNDYYVKTKDGYFKIRSDGNLDPKPTDIKTSSTSSKTTTSKPVKKEEDFYSTLGFDNSDDVDDTPTTKIGKVKQKVGNFFAGNDEMIDSFLDIEYPEDPKPSRNDPKYNQNGIFDKEAYEKDKDYFDLHKDELMDNYEAQRKDYYAAANEFDFFTEHDPDYTGTFKDRKNRNTVVGFDYESGGLEYVVRTDGNSLDIAVFDPSSGEEVCSNGNCKENPEFGKIDVNMRKIQNEICGKESCTQKELKDSLADFETEMRSRAFHHASEQAGYEFMQQLGTYVGVEDIAFEEWIESSIDHNIGIMGNGNEAWEGLILARTKGIGYSWCSEWFKPWATGPDKYTSRATKPDAFRDYIIKTGGDITTSFGRAYWDLKVVRYNSTTDNTNFDLTQDVYYRIEPTVVMYDKPINFSLVITLEGNKKLIIPHMVNSTNPKYHSSMIRILNVTEPQIVEVCLKLNNGPFDGINADANGYYCPELKDFDYTGTLDYVSASGSSSASTQSSGSSSGCPKGYEELC